MAAAVPLEQAPESARPRRRPEVRRHMDDGAPAGGELERAGPEREPDGRLRADVLQPADHLPDGRLLQRPLLRERGRLGGDLGDRRRDDGRLPAARRHHLAGQGTGQRAGDDRGGREDRVRRAARRSDARAGLQHGAGVVLFGRRFDRLRQLGEHGDVQLGRAGGLPVQQHDEPVPHGDFAGDHHRRLHQAGRLAERGRDRALHLGLRRAGQGVDRFQERELLEEAPAQRDAAAVLGRAARAGLHQPARVGVGRLGGGRRRRDGDVGHVRRGAGDGVAIGQRDPSDGAAAGLAAVRHLQGHQHRGVRGQAGAAGAVGGDEPSGAEGGGVQRAGCRGLRTELGVLPRRRNGLGLP